MLAIPKQSDILYIIYKYLKSLDGFNSTTQTLHDEMISSNVLGKTIGWNGEERLYQLADYQQIHPNITEKQIVQHLQKSLSTIPNIKSVNMRSSVLHQLLGIYNPLDTMQTKRFHELASKYVEIIEKYHVNERIIRNAIIRKEYLQSCLSKNAFLFNDEGANYTDPFDSSTSDNNILITSMNSIIETNHSKTSSRIVSVESMLPILQEVGQSKEITHLKSQIHNVNINSQLLQVEINAITEDLAELGCLSTGINRGNIDCGLDLLLSREIGIANVHQHGGSSALSRLLINSGISLGSRMLNRFRVLWTISGHMLNPAYCAVFDQTGRFILSGADDYLVKIWDVNTGGLVKTCKGHLGYISLIVVSPDNSLFASACTMGTIRIWRMCDGLCLQVLKHKASVNWIKFDRTSCALASASDDGQCIVWDLCKLLPEDSAEIPFFDVFIEQKELLKKKQAMSKSSMSKSEPVVFIGTNDQNIINSFDYEMKSSDECLHTISNVAYTPYAGEARLISAVQNSLDINHDIPPHVDYRMNSDIFSTNTLEFREAQQEVIQSNDHAPVHLINSRGGLFYWSGGGGRGEIGVGLGEEDSSRSNGTKLMLPHIQDQFKACGDEEPLKVNCLDISPLGNILVTGCEDGVARVWRFGDVDSYSTRMPKASQALKLLKEMGASPTELARMQRVAKLLLMRLEGHVSPITDIHMNQFGDRVLTGSAQDCNVRIWSLSKDYKNSLHIVLDLNEEENSTIDRQSAAPVGGRARRSRLKSQLYNTCWTTDGTKVITIQSVISSATSANNTNNIDRMPTRLKVWDAMNGDLLRIIWSISSINCRVLIRHPYNSSIVATAGEDGYVNVWNLDQEENLCKLRIYNDDKAPAFLVDASFSEDGTRIALTDNLGRLTLLGLDDPDRYRNVYKEQYFSTDYANIMLDAVGFAIDVGTQMPIHEAPIGLLTSLNGTPYDNQPIIKEVPTPLSKESIRLLLKNIQKDRKHAPEEMDRVYAIFNRNITHHRPHRKYAGVKPNNFKSMTSPSFFEQNQSRVQYREFDINNYQSSSEDSDVSEFQIDNTDRQLTRNINNSGNRNNRRVHTLRDITTQQRRSSRSRNQINSYNDSDNENPGNIQGNATLSRAARAAQRAAKRGSEEIYDYDDDTDSDDDDVTENTSESPILVDSSDDERGKSKSQKKVSIVNKLKKNDDKSRVSRAQLSNGSWYNFKNGIILSSNREVNREWLQTDTRTDQYCPQLGDRVIYLPQGHILWLQDFQETISPPWNKFSGKFPLVECEVRDIQYVFPSSYKEYMACPSVKAIVQLVVTKIPSHHTINSSQGQYKLELAPPRATRNSSNNEVSFEVVLRDGTLPDFLVPSDIFLRSTKLTWSTGINITVNYRENDMNDKFIFTPYSGRIVSLSNSSNDWPHSPWDALEVEWDESAGTEPIGRIGLWEAKPILHPNSMLHMNYNNYKMSGIDLQEEQRILNAIDELFNTDYYQNLFNLFEYPVDTDIVPDYHNIVPVPICIDLIRRRLKNNYYRQIEALRFDVNKLYENCIKYNRESSDIATTATSLKEMLYNIIDNNESYNVHSSLNLKISIKRRRTEVQPEDSLLEVVSNKNKTDHIEEDHMNDIPKRKQSNLRRNNLNNAVEYDINKNDKNNETKQNTRRNRNQINYNDDDDDDEVNSNENEDDDDEEDGDQSDKEDDRDKSKRRSRNSYQKTFLPMNTTNTSSPHTNRRSQRSNTTSKKYIVPNSSDDDSDDFDHATSDDDDDDDDDDVVHTKKQKIGSTRNNRKLKSNIKSNKKSNGFSNNNTTNNILPDETMHRSKRLDPEVKRIMLDIVKKAEELDKVNNYFFFPVTEDYAPSYFSIISNPMDLGTVRNNVMNRKYEDVHELIDDIVLIYDNCLLYNDDSSIIAREALKQKKSFNFYIAKNGFV